MLGVDLPIWVEPTARYILEEGLPGTRVAVKMQNRLWPAEITRENRSAEVPSPWGPVQSDHLSACIAPRRAPDSIDRAT
jgi:hypothetical protein